MDFPIIAATISLDKWSVVTGFPGVVNVERDGLVEPVLGKPSDRLVSLEGKLAGGGKITAIEASSPAEVPQGFTNFIYTGAEQTWEETGAGEGSIVAVVDTGTAPNTCLEHAVIGAPGFPDGYNSTGDGIPANSFDNNWHGTFVGGVIASLCQVTVDPSDLFYAAFDKYLPEFEGILPILGQAPLAQIYPVKVIPASGGGIPASVVLDGLDHVLTLKKSRALDIDVVNMSLGFAALYDGRDSFARFISALTRSGILVVSAAANFGPTPNTIATPASSDDGIAAGGLDYALSSRIVYEFFGYAYYGTPGQGEVMRPTDETRVINFSSRGPLSDGRAGPDISALAIFNFVTGPDNWLYFVSGTSFASPTVAGGAALLNAYMEAHGQETDPRQLKNVLLAGADPTEVGVAWQSHNDLGYGALDIPAALEVLKNDPQTVVPLPQGGNLKANVFQQPVKDKVDWMESDTITLIPGETANFILEVNQYTSKVSFDVTEIVSPDNSGYAVVTNDLEVNLQSARRSWSGRPIQGWYWTPAWQGNSFNITVEDGPWTFAGETIAYQPMEPGLMKFTLAGDFLNEFPVSFKVSILRENFRQANKDPFSQGHIKQSDMLEIPVVVPAGKNQVQFDLNWLRDWSAFPTSDIDMLVFDPEGNLYWDGITLSAPERVVVDSPMAGTWMVYVSGFELYRPDRYMFYVTYK